MCLRFLPLCDIPGQLMCDFLTPTNEDNVLQCIDGSTCNGLTDAAKWSCCGKEGRMKCPKNYPVMCALKTCSPGGDDYCCYEDCAPYGGPRKCE